MVYWRSRRNHRRTRTEERYWRGNCTCEYIADHSQSFAPVVKSILPSKEDEAKRREARRKSLGMSGRFVTRSCIQD